MLFDEEELHEELLGEQTGGELNGLGDQLFSSMEWSELLYE